MPYKMKNGKWRARIQVYSTRYSLGTYRTMKEASAAEVKKQRELARKLNYTLADYPLKYEATEHPVFWRELRKWFKKLRAERRKDKETRNKLEKL